MIQTRLGTVLASPGGATVVLLRLRHVALVNISLIVVGRAHGFGLPLPPNRTGGSPAYGSPVGGCTSKRIDETSISRDQVHQPLLGGPEPCPGTTPQNESRQQPRRFLRRFNPRHVYEGPSGTLSPCRKHMQSYRAVSRRLERHASTFLHPFAPPELPGFTTTMGALTPARRLFVSLSGTMNSAWTRTGLSASCAWPSDHSASNHHLGPSIALARSPSAWKASGSRRFGLRHLAAGSPPEQAESSSLALRTGHIHLRLLPTPPHGDAVTFSYRPESVYLKRTRTSLTWHTHRRTATGGLPNSVLGWPAGALAEDDHWNPKMFTSPTRPDLGGLDAFTHQKHWGCEGPLVVDARLKPQHAPPLEDDPKGERRVEALGAPGGPLHRII